MDEEKGKGPGNVIGALNKAPTVISNVFIWIFLFRFSDCVVLVSSTRLHSASVPHNADTDDDVCRIQSGSMLRLRLCATEQFFNSIYVTFLWRLVFLFVFFYIFFMMIKKRARESISKSV